MSTDPRKPTIDTGPGRTKQAFKDECDINFIMNKWKRTGEIPQSQVGRMPPSYGDFSNADDYMTSCNQVIAARAAFAALPAFLRDRFANEPANLLAFLSRPENQEEAVRLGLAQEPLPDPEEAPEPLPPATEPAPEPSPPGTEG